VRLGAFFEVGVSYFTDRFEPAERIAFSFRASEDDPVARADFEAKASRWLTLFNELGRDQGLGTRFVRPSLGLSEASSYEDAQEAGEEVAREFKLGDAPGVRLAEVLDPTVGVLLLHVDAPRSISGAATQTDPFGAILINRRDPPGRRTFDIAHELFHVLTWDRMPPPALEMIASGDAGPGGTGATSRPRREQLADNFAASLLMPASVVVRLWREAESRSELAKEDVVASMADRFRVSAPALAWRLHNLELLDRTEALPADPTLARAAAARPWELDPPPLFNRDFVVRVRVALEDGVLSFRRAARILDLDSSGLAEMFRAYGMPTPYEA
jgi:Zn-dependent peptidase ImmA (M78 family)